MVLELDEQVVLAEDVLELGGPLKCELLVTDKQRLQHDATEAAGGGDEAFVVARQQLPVDARLVVVALEIRSRGQLEQVLVALRRLSQQRQVVVELVAAVAVPTAVIDLAAAHWALEAGVGRHVRLGADDRIDAVGVAGLVEVKDAVHVAVVGDPERRLAILCSRRDQVPDPRRAVEHRVLGVGVEMGE